MIKKKNIQNNKLIKLHHEYKCVNKHCIHTYIHIDSHPGTWQMRCPDLNISGKQNSTPLPPKRPTTVWPAVYNNPYHPKRTERPPTSQKEVERPESKLHGSSTGEAITPPTMPIDPNPPTLYSHLSPFTFYIWIIYKKI